MALNSFNFLVFLGIVVFIYYIVPKKYQWAVLLVASYGFYLASGFEHVIFILFTTLFTYASGRYMQHLRDKQQLKIDALGEDATKEQKRELKKEVMKKVHTVQVVTALTNLLVLAGIKCLNLVIGGLNDVFAVFKWDASMPLLNIIVPLGLSYYTFNCIGYLIDVGRGKHPAEKHLGKFALFASFFPSIVQGPLYRFNDVGAQLQQPHSLDYDNLKYGAQLILWGFFKKFIIADRIAPVTLTVFGDGFEYTNGSQIFFGVLMYSFQIYGDFSGGTDITRGAAQMLGIELPLNFERPFFATSMADFWRRWHMSLGAWMREMVFFPVMLCKPVTAISKQFRKKFGPHAAKMVPSVAAPMVVFFLIGIWHGVTSQYVVNGIYNALIISSTVALTPFYNKLTKALRINTEAFSWRLFQMVRTFGLLCISRIIVKAPSLPEAFRMIKTMFTSISFGFLSGRDGQIYTYGIDKDNLNVLIIAIGVLLVVGILQENGMKIRETLAKQNLVFRWGMILLLIAFIMIFGVYGPEYDASAFIYERF